MLPTTTGGVFNQVIVALHTRGPTVYQCWVSCLDITWEGTKVHPRWYRSLSRRCSHQLKRPGVAQNIGSITSIYTTLPQPASSGPTNTDLCCMLMDTHGSQFKPSKLPIRCRVWAWAGVIILPLLFCKLCSTTCSKLPAFGRSHFNFPAGAGPAIPHSHFQVRSPADA